MLQQISAQHLSQIKLWYLVQHSLSAYHQLVQYFGSAELASDPSALKQWVNLPIHKAHKQRVEQFLTADGQREFDECLHALQQYCDFIVSVDDENYPAQLRPFDDRPPLLFVQGRVDILTQAQIAVVGSRKTSPHGPQIAYDFSYYLADKGLYITSGLAQGIDYASHQGGLQHQRTIAVIGTGLDQVYPAQNQQLQQLILQQHGAIVTELLPKSRPLPFHFPRRNRIISALSLGTLVVEATIKSGSLSTARWAMEQGKPVFAIPGHIYNEFHQGCHLLIREGAVLVDNPEQIWLDIKQPLQWLEQGIMPVAPVVGAVQASVEAKKSSNNHRVKDNPTQNHSTQNNAIQNSPVKNNLAMPSTQAIDIPQHLEKLYQCLDWTGQDIDQLNARSGLNVQDLTDQLMQLELFDLCIQQAGLYLRKR